MPEIDRDLAHFFAWARERAYRELDERLQADPELDPNWTFSDIMQELLEEYRQRRKRETTEQTELTKQTEKN
ncbi:MAG: hypothetical protein J2P31_09150 [Blastocatellia bacterium]|nr:hypothetical protein [Blastocatellia bacterium]